MQKGCGLHGNNIAKTINRHLFHPQTLRPTLKKNLFSHFEVAQLLV